jgi:hypothetical protein
LEVCLLSATNPENGTTNFLKYDCIGNLLLSQDANGAAGGYKLASTYDAVGRLLSTSKVDLSGAVLQALIKNSYDTLDDSTQGASLGKLVRAISYRNSGDTILISKAFPAPSLPPGVAAGGSSSPGQAAAEGQV